MSSLMPRLYAWSCCIKYLVDLPVEGRLVLEVQSPRNGLRSDLHHVHGLALWGRYYIPGRVGYGTEQRRSICRRAPSQFSGEGAWLAGRTALECCMATSIVAVAVRQLAKLPYEAGLALQLSLARKYKEEQLDEVRANLK